MLYKFCQSSSILVVQCLSMMRVSLLSLESIRQESDSNKQNQSCIALNNWSIHMIGMPLDLSHAHCNKCVSAKLGGRPIL